MNSDFHPSYPGLDAYPPTPHILYKNYKGETGYRDIIPEKIWFGSTEWHKEEQWLLDAFDLGKEALRNFAIKDIQEWASL